MIYLDHHATTPVDERVLQRMLPYFTERFGNAASRQHPFGWQAEEAVEVARGEVAKLIGAQAREIIFTSGATEANNIAILGVAQGQEPPHLITQATEHKSVLEVCQRATAGGATVSVLPVDAYGQLDPRQVAESIQPETRLVSVMAANNEVGTQQAIADIGAICRQHGVLFHVDAAQAMGTMPLDVEAMHIDLLSMSAHKFYGPKGVGALYVRRRNPRVVLEPVIVGGGQERGVRPGTLNVPGIVGLGEAARLALQERDDDAQRITALRLRLYDKLWGGLNGLTLNGHPTERLAGNLHLTVADVEGEALLLSLRELAVSSGAACSSATLQPSHVMRAMGIPDALATSSVRFGIGRFNTAEEIDRAADVFIDAVNNLRKGAPASRLRGHA